MADPHLDPRGEGDPHSADDPGARPGRRSTPGTPRWLLILGIVLVIGLLALVVALHLTGTLGPGAHQ